MVTVKIKISQLSVTSRCKGLRVSHEVSYKSIGPEKTLREKHPNFNRIGITLDSSVDIHNTFQYLECTYIEGNIKFEISNSSESLLLHGE